MKIYYMKKQILIGLVLLFSIVISAQKSNNKYEREWEEITSFEKQSLPQSAMKQADEILQKAIAEKNNTQVIKVLIYKNKYKRNVDYKDKEGIFADLAGLVKQANDPAERALLHSMLAELYANYYRDNYWEIRQRTNLSDFVPEDMKEWSANIFIYKIEENLDLSVKDVDTLKKYTTKQYDDIILLGNEGQKYYPTLYDFLALRAIGVSQVANSRYSDFDTSLLGFDAGQLAIAAEEYIKLTFKQTSDKRLSIFRHYQKYLTDLQNRGLIPTMIMVDIDKIQYLEQRSSSFSGEKILDAYINLYQQYQNNDAAAEIIMKITDSYGYDYKNKSNKDIYDWLKKGLEKYPDYYAINILRNKLTDLEMPSLSIQGKAIQHSQNQVKIDLLYRNTQALKEGLKLTLYKIEKEKYNVIKDYPLNLVSATTYNTDTLSFDLGILPAGKYCFSSRNAEDIENQKENTYHGNDNKFDFVVSDLISFSRNSAKDEYEIFVTDRISGKPIKGVTVKIFENENRNDNASAKLLINITTNELGLALYKHVNTLNKDYYSINYKVELGADSCLSAENIYGQNYRWQQSNEQPERDKINIFTDRGIYRPGQTVYFKAIALDSKSKLITNKSYKAKLYNANREAIDDVELKTNEFGSVSGEFILPQSGLLGHYSLIIDNEAVYLNVEEYKRPTFEVTFDKINKSYTFGEEVKLKGYAKNFSGVSLQDATVKYMINRDQYSFWWRPTRGGSQFADGTVKTNADGSFEIVFTPEAGDGNRPLLRIANDKQIYVFNITATVIDVNGETQSNTYNLTVGNVSMVINIEVPEKIEKNGTDELKIQTRNLEGQDIETSGTYTIYRLDEKDSIQSKVLDGQFRTGLQTELKNKLKSLTSGKYRLQVKALDNKNNEVDEKKDFILYAYSDKKPPVKTAIWVAQKNVEFDTNKPVEVTFGTSEKDAYVLYQLSNNTQIFERRLIKMSNTNQLFKVPYRAEYENELNMTFTFVKGEKLYNENIILTKKKEVIDTELNVKLEVFRDKLRPGQEETWTISVKDSKENPISAELLASMYDISLDKLYPYSKWDLIRPYIYQKYLYPLSYNISWQRDIYPISLNLNYQVKYDSVPFRTTDKINWFGYYVGGGNNILNGRISPSTYDGMGTDGLEDTVVLGFRSAKRTKLTGSISGIRIGGAATMDNTFRQKSLGIVEVPSAAPHFFVDSAIAMEEYSEGQAPSTPQIRQNFNETAFFYPQLRTNDKGETLISFTVPESNTSWRFRALAHDKDMKLGTLEQLVVTRKELMVTPNMPCFVRQGDKTSISTKISNLSEGAISGDVRIEFFDPLTERVLGLNVANQKQQFSIEKDASTSASWTFDIPGDIELIGCRIVAQNTSFSDGEQHVLAVLSNRMLVTESMPIDVTQKGTSTFTLEKLYNNSSGIADNYKLTLEYASNPAWYAVQALPTLSNPSNENAVNWFASYYVNTLGSSIVRQYPKVAAMIQAWLKQGGDKETLVSKLQKDEELKAVLLEETPWVLDAKDETEQMQRLSLLFDLNNTRQQTEVATRKLAELQNSEGGWCWYKGLYPSRSITQYILYGYAQLQKVGQVQYPDNIKTMQMNALKYIDKQLLDNFNSLKKYNKDWEKSTLVSTNQIEFAYVRSFYRDIPINQETREAERFYIDIASKNWTKLNLYEQAILSIVLKRNGEKALADKIVKSIKEHAVNDKKLGMYWPNNRNNVFMSMSAICVHTFVMEALQENGATEQEMNAMKRWLLSQKQTQVWESTHASIDAIAALLNTRSDWFTGNTSATTISVGETKVEPENKELGTGYFKKVWDKSEINNNMAKVEVTNTSSEQAYGALYWQYFENLDKITSQKGDLNVEKQLFKENTTASGKALSQITENNPLTIGDKVVVRLTIRVNRDMEFVQLKDMRAPCFEPLQSISGIKWANNLIYYQMPKDASTNFYFDRLPKGTYVLEYPVYVNRSGEYSNGITTIQCMYAPQFVSHTQGMKVIVN